MLHFSLNNNGFSFEESQKIAEVALFYKALKTNKTIYGFHFSGNYGYIDYLGYLQFDVSQRELQDKLSEVRIKSLERQHFSYQIDPYEYKTLLTNCCWICEGWIELEFIYPESTPN